MSSAGPGSVQRLEPPATSLRSSAFDSRRSSMAAQPGDLSRWHFGLLATALLLTAGVVLSVGLWRDPPPAATSENPPSKTLPVEFDIRHISKQDSGFLVQLRVRNL